MTAMTSERLRVAVVGAGASGLTAVKCCLDEGLSPTCFERSANLGGLWRYTDEVGSGQTCVMKSTVINSSKELLSFSDFPMPAHFPNFMHNSQVLEYFNLYADRFDLKRHIQFQTEVCSVTKTDDHCTTGRWVVTTRALDTNEKQTAIFDAVMIGVGHQAIPHLPDFEGLKDFQGKVLHTNDYKKPDGYEDKKVLIVGAGNSAGDCAVELSRVAKQVYMSTRRGCWIGSRVGKQGYPMDLQKTTRFVSLLSKTFKQLYERWMESEINQRFDHKLFRLQPAHSLFSYPLLLNDDLPNRIVTGTVKVKDGVKRFTRAGVEFVDGTREEDVDVVILATGFRTSFPFLSGEVLKKEKNKVRLYKVVFPPDLERGTLALIGCLQPAGAFLPMVEMQSRWATRVFKGLLKLPDASRMWEDVNCQDAVNASNLIPSQHYSSLVKYLPYMDELAKLIGCYPDF
ncbi:dimethylaniline monooxygenase [N-oxide-forming], partial [Elysia marginata]